jgi:hypothetical protein
MLAQLKNYPKLILAVIKYEHRLTETIEQFKAVVQLVDSSQLHINEVWLDGELIKYAYYWLTLTGEVIQGWDNAPHHPEISTHPHHLHRAGQIYSSEVRALADVLDLLTQRLVD